MLIRKITINTTPFQTEPLQSTFNPPVPLAPPRDVSVRTPLPFANQAACAQLRPAQLQPALPTSSLSPVAWWHVNQQQFKMPMRSKNKHKQKFKMSSENKQTTVQNAMEFRQQLGLLTKHAHETRVSNARSGGPYRRSRDNWSLSCVDSSALSRRRLLFWW